MQVEPVESRALRQLIWAGLIGLLIGFLSAAIGLAWVWIKYEFPEKGGWAFPAILQYTFYSGFAGLLVAALSVNLLDRWHYFRGVHLCNFCQKKLSRGPKPCACRLDEYQDLLNQFSPANSTQIRRIKFRRKLQRGLRSARWYVAVIPVAYLLAVNAPPKNTRPFALNFVVLHAAICLIAVKLVAIYTGILQLLDRARRLRLRMNAVASVIAIWPVACVIAYLGYSVWTYLMTWL